MGYELAAQAISTLIFDRSRVGIPHLAASIRAEAETGI